MKKLICMRLLFVCININIVHKKTKIIGVEANVLWHAYQFFCANFTIVLFIKDLFMFKLGLKVQKFKYSALHV